MFENKYTNYSSNINVFIKGRMGWDFLLTATINVCVSNLIEVAWRPL